VPGQVAPGTDWSRLSGSLPMAVRSVDEPTAGRGSETDTPTICGTPVPQLPTRMAWVAATLDRPVLAVTTNWTV